MLKFEGVAEMDRCIEIVRFARPVRYGEAMQAQHERRVAVEEGRLGNALFLLEHRPVITLGRRAHGEHVLRSEADLAALGIELCETNRGGDVMYHGPGQLVAYPILDLNLWHQSIGWYLRSLEEVVIRVLAAYGLQGEREPGYTGVWVGGAKVAAVGVGIHNWVTFHGVALNVDPDMAHFRLIVPCGIADRPLTSLKQIVGEAAPMPDVMAEFEQQFKAYFESDAWRDLGQFS